MIDVRFLSIDIDSLQQHNQVIQQFHTGVSVLDSPSLNTSIIGLGTTIQAAQVIESHHYIVGSPKFARNKSNKFIFGEPEAISLAGLEDKFRSLILDRDVVLVFHGGSRELWALEVLSIDLHPLYIIDTVKAAQHPLQLSYRCSLEKMLSDLGIPFAALHFAGNDAHFVLRALLMLAVRDAQRELAAGALPEWLSNSSAIAQAPRPFTKAEIEAIAQGNEPEKRQSTAERERP